MIVFLTTHYIELLGVLFSVLYLVLSIRQNIWLWPVGILSAVMYMIVFYHSKFYADMSLNAYYFVISIYGWIHWNSPQEGQDALPVQRTRRQLAFILVIIFIVLFAGTGILLDRYTDSPVPYWDALTTAASIVATWMLTRKMLEHWIVWVFVDVVSMVLYIYRGLHPTALLFGLYTIMALVGYKQWKKSYKSQIAK